MATQNYFILTAAERTAAMAFNSPDAAVDPRAIDSATPGSCINTNEGATNFDVGDPVSLTGKFVAPVRIVNDPDYLHYVPGMVTYLLTMPSAILENETIFLPSPDE